MPDMDLGDATIHYEEAGAGSPTFVFCHGLGGSGDGFVEEFPFWKEHFPHVVTWDARGLGRSSQAARYNMPLYASDLDRLLERLAVEKAVLHGVSWGGVLVQQFAFDYPERCTALVIDSSSSEANLAASENWYNMGEVARLGADARLTAFRPAFEGHVSSVEARREQGGGVKPEHVDSYVASARAAAALREHPYTPRLKHISCPVLVVAGGSDPVAGVGGSVIMARNLPNARLEIFEGAGHGIYRDRRDAFRALVLEFCRDHGIV